VAEDSAVKVELPVAEREARDMAEDVIVVEELWRIYGTGNNAVAALRGVTFRVPKGEMVAIMGPSGSGKSTLLNILGCLDRPTRGRYLLGGEDTTTKSDDALADIRNRKVGFVFQDYLLLPQLTALENVELPLIYRGLPGGERRRRAQEALAAVGLTDRAHHRPFELSGGQQQRVGIARALAGRPEVILADEPTGNLDSVSGLEVLALFADLHAQGATLVIVTHDDEVARSCERVLRVRDGTIVADERVIERRDVRAELAAMREESA
jgi:putative ABC transport system ATP-binding protein